MSLNVAVFVPEGIILASDTLAYIKNEDDGYPSKAQRTFCVWNKYIVSFVGNGYINGLPYGYYIESFLIRYKEEKIENVRKLTDKFSKFICEFTDKDNLTIYFAGCEIDKTNFKTRLYLFDKGNIVCLNYDDQTSLESYNYHFIGNGIWVNKLLLPTTYIDEIAGIKEEFQPARIDFTKYSLETAIDFAKLTLSLTSQMEELIQVRRTVNTDIHIAIVTPSRGAYYHK